jgi:hypothetical protein
MAKLSPAAIWDPDDSYVAEPHYSLRYLRCFIRSIQTVKDTVRQQWDEQELAEHWTLTADELQCIRNRTDRNRIGFAATLKFFQVAGRFPYNKGEIPRLALEHLARELCLNQEVLSEYKFTGRSYERDRSKIRNLVGFCPATLHDANRLTAWLQSEVLPIDHRQDHLRDAALEWCRKNGIEPPAPTRLDRIIGSAMNSFQSKFFSDSLGKIPLPCHVSLDKFLEAPDDGDDGSDIDRTPMAELRSDPGRPSLESILKEIEKLNAITEVGLPIQLFNNIPAQVLDKYRLRAATEPPRELRRHP